MKLGKTATEVRFKDGKENVEDLCPGRIAISKTVENIEIKKKLSDSDSRPIRRSKANSK